MSKCIDVSDLLRSHGLKRTPIRTEILELFLDHEYALMASEIEAKMQTSHDRVTVYRALTSFEEKGIIHRASEDWQGIKFALSNHECMNETHSDKHAHMVCEICGQTYCLESVSIPPITVSEDISINKVSLVLSGVCKNCKSAAES